MVQGVRPACKTCGNPCKSKGTVTKRGLPQWKTRCEACLPPRGKHKYRGHKGPACELCGFVPVNKCQLDVDHIDGNHKNNSPANLQTLCANCHRLKTWLCGDHIKEAPNERSH